MPFRYLLKNADLNHVTAHCHLCREMHSIRPLYRKSFFDRLIIPAPYAWTTHRVSCSRFLSRGGRVHFYTFKAKEQIPGLIAAFKGKGLTVTYSSPCGNVAPGISRWVFDMTRTPRQ